ncbi:MAG: hypothetical protein IT295_11070, partial [Dehalococcoidia bacterium]|nr:hypothetical protein [Dehalococcoidia bacterium]
MIVSGGVFLAGRTARAAAAPGSVERFRGSLVMGAGIVLFVLWAGLHTALASIKPVEAGHVGV